MADDFATVFVVVDLNEFVEPTEKAWDESKHPRKPAGSAQGGEWTSPGGTPVKMNREARQSGQKYGNWKQAPKLVDDLKAAVPELQHFKHSKDGDHHWLLASTESTKSNSPATLPGHETATGMAIKVNPTSKHVYFSELNSHIKGAGRRMVDATIKAHPDYKFSVTDWSGMSQGENRKGPSFWDKVFQKYPKQFEK